MNIRICTLVLAFLIPIVVHGKAGKPTGQYGFIENKGQIIDQNGRPNNAVKFLWKGGSMNVQLKANSFSYEVVKAEPTASATRNERSTSVFPVGKHDEPAAKTLKIHRVDVELIGANPAPATSLEEMGNDIINYYTAGVPVGGVTNVHHYNKVVYKNIYPNIDIEFVIDDIDNNTSKAAFHHPFKYNFIVKPGGNVNDIRLKYNGANNTHLDEKGGLSIATSNGELEESIPLSYEQRSSAKVQVRYKQTGKDTYGMVADAYDHSQTLVVDPWATYYGGNGTEWLDKVDVDASDNIYAVGFTESQNNIATAGAFQAVTNGVVVDAMLVKFTASGVRLWATYYGGGSFDYGNAVKVDINGDVIITGFTNGGTGLTTPGAFQTTVAGDRDAFIAKFNPSGSIIWGTFFGDTHNDIAGAVTTDNLGNIFITGYTSGGSSLATPGAAQTTLGGASDGFLVKFSSTGTRLWSTYVGGSSGDEGNALVADNNGDVYLLGEAMSSNGIATTGSHQPVLAGEHDAIIVKYNSGGVKLWGTYLGGSFNEVITGAAIKSNGNLVFSGFSASSSGIATPGSYQSTLSGNYDVFIAELNSAGALQWGTYYGGSDVDMGESMALDAAGNVFVCGRTRSTNMSTPGTHQSVIGGSVYHDAFLAKFDNTGARVWSTYFGSSGGDEAYGVAAMSSGNIVIVGSTQSLTQIATPGSHQPYYGGDNDAFIAVIDPSGVIDNSIASACSGTPVAGLINAAHTTICPGYIDTLFYLGNTMSTGLSFQWQSSAPGANVWTDIAGATNPVYAQYILGTQDFRLKISCSNSPAVSSFSNVLPIHIYNVTYPTITSSGPTSFCSGPVNVTLTASPGASYIWQGNSGSFTPSATNQSITVNQYGTFWLKVTDANGCTYEAPPVQVMYKVMSGNYAIKTIGSAGACAPGTVTLSISTAYSLISGFGFQWNLNGNPIPGANDTMYTANVSGSYSLTLTGGGGCTKTTNIKVVTIKPTPTASFTVGGPTTFCSGGQVTLTAPTVAGVTYSWLKNGNTNAGSGASKNFIASGDYAVIATQNGCKDTSAAETITVHQAPPLPKILSSLPTSVCAGKTVQLWLDPAISSGGASFQWKLAGSPITGATDSVYQANATGAHTLTLTTANGCTKTSAAKTATIKPVPTATFTAGSTTTFCAGGQVILTAPTVAGVTYAWLKDGVSAGTGVNKTIKASGVYVLVATQNGCMDTSDNSETVTVIPLPVASVSTTDPTTICAGDSATLGALPAGMGYTYAWYKSNAVIPGISTNTYEAKTAATYKVMVTDNNGCVSKMSNSYVVIKVTPLPTPTITAQGSTTIPSNGNVKLVATPGSGVTWQWYKDGVAIPGATTKNYIVTTGGDYTVEVTKQGCTGVSTITTVTQSSAKEETGTTSVAAGEELQFEFVAYPNPVSNRLTIGVKGIEEVNALLQVMDMNGRLMTTVQMTNYTIAVDMSSYANGMYLVRYKDKGGRAASIKISKQ